MIRGRFVSLLPSATEILGGLGLAQHVVGVTHECDVCPDNSGTYQPDSTAPFCMKKERTVAVKTASMALSLT